MVLLYLSCAAFAAAFALYSSLFYSLLSALCRSAFLLSQFSHSRIPNFSIDSMILEVGSRLARAKSLGRGSEKPLACLASARLVMEGRCYSMFRRKASMKFEFSCKHFSFLPRASVSRKSKEAFIGMAREALVLQTSMAYIHSASGRWRGFWVRGS